MTLIGLVVAILIGLFMVVSVLSAPKKAEVVVPSGVSGLYGVSNGKIYYRVGRTLIAKPVKGKGLETITDQFNTAAISPDGTELFYRTMTNYVIDGYKLNLETQSVSKQTDITDGVWCGLSLFTISEQEASTYIIKDAKGQMYFQNVPTNEVYCLNNELVYNASNSLSDSEDGGTLTLKYLSQTKSNEEVKVSLQESPILQNNKQLSYINNVGSLILANTTKDIVLPLRVTNAITTQHGSGEMYVVDSPSSEETSVDLYRVDLLSKNFAKVASYITKANVEQNLSNIDTNIVFEYERYLYFMVGNSIVRVKL
jgi:hypothetical protein